MIAGELVIPVDQRLDHFGHLLDRDALGPRRCADAGHGADQIEKVRRLVIGEPQRRTDGVQHLIGDPCDVSPLDLRVVLGADPRQLRGLLAP